MTYGHLQADCLYTGISSGPNARYRVWEAFTFTFLKFSVSNECSWSCGRVQVCNMFIVSLAIADLIVGLVVMPMSTIYIFTVDWRFGVALCQLWIAVDYTASTASILNLFVLSLDRYWSVTSPLEYLSKRTTKRALVMISLVLNLCLLRRCDIGTRLFAKQGSKTDRETDRLYTIKQHSKNKNSSGDEIANVNFYAVRPEATRVR